MYTLTKKTHSRLMEKLIQDNLFSISYNECMRPPLLASSSTIIPTPKIKPGKIKSLTDRKQPLFPFNLQMKANGNGTVFNDPAFMENRTAPVHRWVPWIAGFSGAFVDSVLATALR